MHKRLPLIPYIAVLAVLSVFLLTTSKAESFYLLTVHHHSFSDQVFRCISFLGNGYFSILVVLFSLLRKKWSAALLIFSSYLGSGIAVQVLKRIWDIERPRQSFLHQGINIQGVPGVEQHMLHSFPSGHMASAVSLAICLSVLVQNKKWTWLFWLLAWLVGYSRIYLGQHFPVDIWAGAILGMLFSCLVFALHQQWFESGKLRWQLAKFEDLKV